MVIVSIKELIDVVIMTLALGYIFGDVFSRHRPVPDDPLLQYTNTSPYWENFKFACLVTAPAIILHEIGHKVVAIFFGLQATFHAAYTWLALGIGLKLLNFGFIFFVPAYVSISGGALPLESSLIAFAGPGVNLILWIAALVILKNKPNKKYIPALVLTKQINMFLFFFNMIPLGFFDGAKVFSGLFAAFG